MTCVIVSIPILQMRESRLRRVSYLPTLTQLGREQSRVCALNHCPTGMPAGELGASWHGLHGAYCQKRNQE